MSKAARHLHYKSVDSGEESADTNYKIDRLQEDDE